MSNVVVVGLLRAIEPGRITLSGNLQIIVPAEEPEAPVPGAAPAKPAEPEADDDLEKRFRK